MAMVCTTVTEWIETKVSKPVEDWVERTEEKCKKRPWYDPRRWLCWLVTTLVKIIRWVVITVLTAVIKIVCHLVADLLGILWDLLLFLKNLLKALFTWDKCALQEALGNLGDAITRVVQLIGNVVIRPITDRIQTYRLRGYVGEQIEKRFAQQPELIEALKEAFNVNTGVFGYRMTCTIYRMYVDSKTKTERYGEVPHLYALHDAGLINLYELAGFEQSCAIFSEEGWYRPRHQTATFPFGSGGGIGEPTPPELKRERLDEYIKSEGRDGPHFRIYTISPGHLDMRINAAKEKGRQLGLILDFNREDKEITDPEYINYKGEVVNFVPIDCQTYKKGQIHFLILELGRHPKSDFEYCDDAQQPTIITGSLEQALAELCSPVAVAVFGFIGKKKRGLASNPIGTTSCEAHNLDASITSGVSFIDDIPDQMRKYVLIHELGHYFGLCHVDGFDRIMVSGAEGQGKLWTWDSIPNIFWHGGPRFIYTEAQRVWDFILANFPLSCLAPNLEPTPTLLRKQSIPQSS